MCQICVLNKSIETISVISWTCNRRSSEQFSQVNKIPSQPAERWSSTQASVRSYSLQSSTLDLHSCTGMVTMVAKSSPSRPVHKLFFKGICLPWTFAKSPIHESSSGSNGPTLLTYARSCHLHTYHCFWNSVLTKLKALSGPN